MNGDQAFQAAILAAMEQMRQQIATLAEAVQANTEAIEALARDPEGPNPFEEITETLGRIEEAVVEIAQQGVDHGPVEGTGLEVRGG